MGNDSRGSIRPRTGFFQHLPTGGAIRAASNQLAGLAGDLDLRIHVPEDGAAFSPDPGLETRRWPFPEGARLRGAERLAAPLLMWRKLRAFEALCGRIAAAMEQEGCEKALVHPSTIVTAPPLIILLGIPSVYYCHEYPRHIYERGVTRTPGRLTELLVRHVIRRERDLDRQAVAAASVLVSNSDFMAPRLEAAYGRAPVVVRPSVDASAFTPSFGPGTGFALSVGAIHPLKGHDLTVRAVGLIPPAARPPLVIVGDRGTSGEAGRIEKLAAGLGVDLRIRVGVPFAELAGLYATASVVICAQRNEPYGFVPLEAMASGRPVVAVAEGGFVENVIDGLTGVLVPRDAREMAGAVAALLSDPVRASALGSAGRDFVVRERSPGAERAAMLDLVSRASRRGGGVG